MSLRSTIWVEKYRPQVIKDMIIPDKVVNKVEGGLNNHILMYGGPGLGKTTLAKIIAKNGDMMYVNCSVDTGVDVVRNKITQFCSTIGLAWGNKEKKEKYVILDEFDGVSDAYMKAMRGTIEEFADTTKFIATCNFINKIPDYMKSRFDCIDFNFPEEDKSVLIKKYMKRIHAISQNEGLNIEVKANLGIVKNYFPDLRRTISFLQSVKDEGKNTITEEDLKVFRGEYKELYQMFFDPKVAFFDIYSYIYKKYLNSEDKVFISLGTEFLEYVVKEQPSKQHLIGPLITMQADWHYKSQFVADKIAPLAALCDNILKITK